MESSPLSLETVHTLKNLTAYSADTISKKIVSKKNGGDILLMAFKNGQELKEHTATSDALVQVLDGKCNITINGNSFHLEAGQFIIMPANIPHAVASDGDFQMLLTRIKD